MAISKVSTLGTVAPVGTPGNSVAPVTALPDNCHTIIIYNESATNTILVGNAQLYALGAAIPVNEAIHVPPESSLTLMIGPLSQRPATGFGFLHYDASGGSATARVTYVCGLTS